MDYEIGDVANIISGKKLSKKNAKRPTTTTINSGAPVQPLKKIKLIQPAINNESSDEDACDDISEANSSCNSSNQDDESQLKATSKDETSEKSKTQMNLPEENSSDDETATEKAKPKFTPQQLKELNKRTIFVGNVPFNCQKEQLIKIFKKYGSIENARLRCVPVSNINVPKKIAIMKKEFHPNRSSVNAYVRFKNEADAKKSLTANGTEYKGHHLRVTMAENPTKPDMHKAIFIGNLKFDTEEEELWKFFEICGEISSVRLIRDKKTNVGKGFGYVNFTTSDAVELALQMEDVKFKGRDLRINLCKDDHKKPKKNRDAYLKRKSHGDNKNANAGAGGNSYQGRKFTEKKHKKKPNKGLMQKKKFAKKLAGA